MIYIACPFWDEDREIRWARVQTATRYAAKLSAKGILCYSPLTYGREIEWSLKYEGTTEAYWREHGLAMLRACDEIHVLKIPGWKKSEGVKEELRVARHWGHRVVFVKPEEIET